MASLRRMANGKVRIEATACELQDDDSKGICIGCGEEASGVEPDARLYECEACGKRKVYGLMELVEMGAIHLVDHADAGDEAPVD